MESRFVRSFLVLITFFATTSNALIVKNETSGLLTVVIEYKNGKKYDVINLKQKQKTNLAYQAFDENKKPIDTIPEKNVFKSLVREGK